MCFFVTKQLKNRNCSLLLPIFNTDMYECVSKLVFKNAPLNAAKAALIDINEFSKPTWPAPSEASGGVGGKIASGIASSSESQIPEVFLFMAEIDLFIPLFKV